jgi:transcriptional regulator GlxA family with amidase domain
MRNVSIIGFEGALALDIVGPADVFAMANRMVGTASEYRIELISMSGGLVTTSAGLTLQTLPASAATMPIDTLMVAGGCGIEERSSNDPLVCWIRAASANARRICGVCTGAFALAAAGLLDGRKAVTHWDSGCAFSTRFPNVQLDLRPIYLHDGRVWTSAGVTAGIDLALALVEEDLGRGAALAVAKQLVIFLHRPGGQAQFSTTLMAQTRALNQARDHPFYELHGWIADHLEADLSVAALSARSHMTKRSFARRYLEVMGVTPAKAVAQARFEAAARALEQGEQSIKRIAETCGYGDEEGLRRLFVKRIGVTPSAYRERFARQQFD